MNVGQRVRLKVRVAGGGWTERFAIVRAVWPKDQVAIVETEDGVRHRVMWDMCSPVVNNAT